MQSVQDKNDSSTPDFEKIAEIIKDKNMRNSNFTNEYLTFEKIPDHIELIESFEIFSKNVSDSGIPVVQDDVDKSQNNKGTVTN